MGDGYGTRAVELTTLCGAPHNRGNSRDGLRCSSRQKLVPGNAVRQYVLAPGRREPHVSDVLDRLTTALAERYRVEREIGAGGRATTLPTTSSTSATLRSRC